MALLLVEAVVHFARWHTTRPLRGAATADAVAATGGIVAIGDSWTFGVGAPPGYSWPAQLAARLAQDGFPLSVANLAEPGANSSEAVAHLARALDAGARPAWVVAAMGTNNLWSFRRASFWTDFPPEQVPVSMIHRLASRTGTGRLLALAAAGQDPWPRAVVDPVDSAAIYTSEEDLADAGFSSSRSDRRQEREFLAAWLRHDFDRLCEAGDRSGFRIAVLSYHFGRLNVTETQRTAAEACPGAVFISALAFGNPIGGLPGAAFLSEDGWHPNERGYARVAELVHAGLLDVGLLPPGPAPSVPLAAPPPPIGAQSGSRTGP